MTEYHHTQIHRPDRRGFTIVELLIVIVVIAILAAIVIMAYTGIQNKAHAAAAQSASNSVAKLLNMSYTTNGTYPSDLTTINNGNPMPNTDGSTYAYHPGSGNTSYCVTVTNGTASYKVTDTSGAPVAGGCPGDGVGGVAAITNLHPNPGAISGTGYGSWAGNTGNTNTTGVVAAAWSRSGSAYRSTWTAANNNTGDLQVYVNSNSILQPNTVYTVRYRVVANQNSTVSSPGLYSSAGTNTLVAKSYSGSISYPAGTPMDVWATFQGDATALTSGFRILLNPRNVAAGDSFDISEAVLYPGSYNSAIGFYWGNSPNWIWNGAANNSTSTGPQ